MISPKNVIVTALSVRFPLSGGWTLDVLRQYSSGDFELKTYDPMLLDDYFVPKFGTDIDFEAMHADGHIGRVLGKEQWPELDGLDDLDALLSRV